jgi:hypothetical protein
VTGEIAVGATDSGVLAVGDFLGNLGGKSISIVFDQVGNGATPGEDFCQHVQI